MKMNKAIWARVLYEASKMSDEALRNWYLASLSTYLANTAAAVFSLDSEDSDMFDSKFRRQSEYEIVSLLASLCRSRGIVWEVESDA